MSPTFTLASLRAETWIDSPTDESVKLARIPSIWSIRSAARAATTRFSSSLSSSYWEIANIVRNIMILRSNSASFLNSESSDLKRACALPGFPPSLLRYTAALKVRIPTLRVKFWVSRNIPAIRSSDSSLYSVIDGNAYSRISLTSSLADDAVGSTYVIIGSTGNCIAWRWWSIITVRSEFLYISGDSKTSGLLASTITSSESGVSKSWP